MGLQPDIGFSCIICFSSSRLTRKTDLAVQQQSQSTKITNQTPIEAASVPGTSREEHSRHGEIVKSKTAKLDAIDAHARDLQP